MGNVLIMGVLIMSEDIIEKFLFLSRAMKTIIEDRNLILLRFDEFSAIL